LRDPLIFARTLTAQTPGALRERLSAYLDEPSCSRAADRAQALPLIVETPPPRAGELVPLFEAQGAFAQLTRDHFVVVATPAALRAVAGAADGETRALAEALLRAAEASLARTTSIRLRDRTLDVGRCAAVMGILNVTPDSFYDRGRYRAVDAARARAAAMVEQGAALIDIGGHSYAAWNEPVAAEEEERRVVPVVRALLADGLGVPLSIDTFKANVARAALEAGADLINDCSGLSDDALAGVVARYDAALVVMHLKGRLNVRDETYPYDDAMAEILAFLRERVERAVAGGVARESLIVDPGLEFGKEPQTDLEILERFGDLRALGLPILFAASRKSFIGRIFNQPASELLVPSLATAAVGIAAGASLIRVHDVAETVQLARMLGAVQPENRGAIWISPPLPKDRLSPVANVAKGEA